MLAATKVKMSSGGQYSRLREKIEKPRTGKNVDLKLSTGCAV